MIIVAMAPQQTSFNGLPPGPTSRATVLGEQKVAGLAETEATAMAVGQPLLAAHCFHAFWNSIVPG